MATTQQPHVRCPLSTRDLLRAFMFASIPTAGVGLWNLGHQTLSAAHGLNIDATASWPGNLIQILGITPAPDAILPCTLYGLLRVLPLLITVLAVAYGWERIIAKLRKRAMDPSWYMTAWLLVLLLPPATPVLLAAIAASFAAVVGTHIFGGTGRYLVSPALLGVLFLHFSYPGFVAAALPLPDVELATSWSQAAMQGPDALSLGATMLGAELGAVGTTSAAACLLGLVYLIRIGAASARTVLGAFAGLLLTATLMQLADSNDPAWQLPWYWHLALGNFVFATVFLATDPTCMPLTIGGRWLYGILFGALAVLLRVADPTHPEGSLFALLLAGLAVPLLDHLVLRATILRTSKRRLAA